jgi:phenylpyruvate tautomerase PptA (4-oxalocrotonate tautomerase family)
VPYLRITCPPINADRRRLIAERLTQAVVDLFHTPRAPISRDDLRERTTVHFTAYGDHEMFVGGRTPTERGHPDVTVEFSDWNMSGRKQQQVARELTPLLAELFEVSPAGLDNINIRFHPYPPKDFAVGGELLSDRIPRMARLAKRLFG